MCSPGKSSSNTFLDLLALLDSAYGPPTAFRCAHLKPDTKPCGNKGTKGSLELAKQSFERLFVTIDDNLRDTHGLFDGVLAKLIESCLCPRRHQQNAEHARSQWLEELYNDEKRLQLRHKLHARLAPLAEERISSSPPPSFIEFEPYETKTSPKSKTDVELKVTNKVAARLGDADKKSGYIYLIAHPREPKMFKVGHSVDTEKRFLQHEKCLKDPKLIKSEQIPYVHRIEQIIFAEFSRRRYQLKEPCQCKTRHKEWIQVSKAKLVASLEKWVKFARGDMTPPYDKDGYFRRGHVALPYPAMDFKSLKTPTKNGLPRQSDVCLTWDSTPSKGSQSDTSFSDEGVSDLSYDEGGSDDDRSANSSSISNLSARLDALRCK